MNNTLITRAGTTVAVAMIALAAFASIEDITLKRKPKVGDVGEYKVSAVFTTDQGEVTFAQKRVEKVTEVKPEGNFVMKVTSSETKISFGGQELPDQPETSSTEEIGPDGLLRTVTADTPVDANSYRIGNLHALKTPDADSKIGDEIKFEIPADKTKGTPGVKASYKVIGTEKVKDWDTVKLTFTAEETEGDVKSSVKGTVWLSTADGSVVKVQEEWKDVQPTGAPFPVNGKYNVERTK